MRVMLVYANDRMDNLISIAPSILSAFIKKEGHDVKLYDTTFIDEGKEVGDEFRAKTLQIKAARLSDQGLTRTKMSTTQLQDDFRRAVTDFKPGLIGFSALEITYDQTARLIDGIKDLPTPIVVGGMYPTFAPRQVLKDPYVDMICEGEGELAFTELANKLAVVEVSKLFDIQFEDNGEVVRNFNPTKEIRETLNISMRIQTRGNFPKFFRSGTEVKLEDFGSGDYLETKKVGLLRPDINMNNLTTPDYTIYEDRRFLKPMAGYFFRTVTIESARGCPYKCAFCCVPQQQEHHRAAKQLREEVRQGKRGQALLSLLQPHDGEDIGHHKQKSPFKIVNEVIEAVENHKINYAFFADETFLAKSRKWLETFFEEWDRIRLPPGTLPESYVKQHPRFVRADGTERLPFFACTRVETVTDHYAKELERIGCANMALGIESGNPVYRKEFLKRMMPDSTIIAGFKAFEGTDIRISANNIIGFPHETREDIFNTIELNRITNADSIMVNAFRPYTGTPLREECIKMGLIPPGIRAEDNRALEQFYNGVLSAQEIEGLRRTFVLYVTFPKERWDEVRKAETDDETFEKLSKEFHDNNMLERKCRINRYDQNKHNLEISNGQGIELTSLQ
ncbi:MAG: radical SAM protein [Nanoarchaeota archaeon]